jgi:hypothetical protein
MAAAKKQYSEKELIGKGTFGKIYKAKKRSSKGFEVNKVESLIFQNNFY